MNNVKWIKIVTDMFDNRKIRQIEALPDGDSIIVIWVKLLCLAGNVNEQGYLFFTKEVPYTEDMMAVQFNRPISTIRLALHTFEQFGMIEIIDDIIKISNWEEYQNVDGMEKIKEQTRLRVARYRERKKISMNIDICSYCGEPASGVDHIIAIARGGSEEDYNKIPCCQRCNLIKNDKPLVDFLNNNRAIVDDALIASNEKLMRYVTLSNVTGRYEVTHGNAIDIEEDIEEEKELDKEKYIGKTEVRHRYGEYKNVLLSDTEMEKLKAEFPNDYESRIEDVSNYCKSHGKTYKDYLATIRSWARKEAKRENKPSGGRDILKELMNA